MDTTIKFPDITNTLQLIGCHFGVKPPSWEFPKHHHHFFELLFCWDGEITQVINREVVHLNQGDWLLINSGVRHYTMNRSNSHYVYFNAHFDLDDMKIRKQLGVSPYIMITSEEAALTKLPSYAEVMESLFHKGLIKNQIQEIVEVKIIHSSFIDRIYLQAHIFLIIGELLSFPQQKKTAGSTHSMSSSYITDVAHAIEECLVRNLNADISITDISTEFHLSRYQSSKIFSQVYGMSPRQYLSRLKLNKAKELLVNTNMTVEAVADQLGFHSVSHFSRQFRRWSNQAPSHFRPKHRTLESVPDQPHSDQ
ncbi:MAG: AraC family transcriptional regulator [Candidatus Pristimantibacillus sp.]